MSDTAGGRGSFIERYLRGEVEAAQIDDFIDEWHENPVDRQLHEYLGMTAEEYSLWLCDPDALPQIAQARREKRPLAELLRSALHAAGPDANKLPRLRQWLAAAEKLG